MQGESVVGLGETLEQASSSMALAPETISSAGWAMKTSVPFHLAFISAKVRALPSQPAMWTSWPQLWATKLSAPLLTALARLA